MVPRVIPKPGRLARGSRSWNCSSSGLSSGKWMCGTMNLAYSGPAMIAVGIPIRIAYSKVCPTEAWNACTASIGRYGPYLAHDGKYARLGSTAEVFETGINEIGRAHV